MAFWLLFCDSRQSSWVCIMVAFLTWFCCCHQNDWIVLVKAVVKTLRFKFQEVLHHKFVLSNLVQKAPILMKKPLSMFILWWSKSNYDDKEENFHLNSSWNLLKWNFFASCQVAFVHVTTKTTLLMLKKINLITRMFTLRFFLQEALEHFHKCFIKKAKIKILLLLL